MSKITPNKPFLHRDRIKNSYAAEYHIFKIINLMPMPKQAEAEKPCTVKYHMLKGRPFAWKMLPKLAICCAALLLTASIMMTDPVTIRVASYNVEFSRSATPEQIGAMFKSYNLDIVGFNEAPDGDWTDRVGKVLGMKYSYCGKISSANHKNKYKSILSRTPLEGMSEYTLQADGGWNPASAVRAATIIDGVMIAFYSTHVSGRSDKSNGHSQQLANVILPKEIIERVIIVGDFNNEIGDFPITTLEESGMRPIWYDLKIDTSKHFTWNAQDPEKKSGVIDHILYKISSGARANNGGIIELTKPLSDHKPIWAEIVFPRELKKVKNSD